MEALSNCCWVPATSGRHLHVVPRCYTISTSSRRDGSCGPTRLSGRNPQLIEHLMKFSMFLSGEGPICQFHSRSLKDLNLRISTIKRLAKSAKLPFRLTPVALGNGQRDQDSMRNSSGHQFDSPLSHIAPNWPGLKGSESKTKRTLLKSTFIGRYQREIIHKDVHSRLKAVGTAAARKRQQVPIIISETDNEHLRSASSNDKSGNSLAADDEKWLLPPKGPRTQADKQVEQNHRSRKKETRRNILKHCLPPVLDRLGFQFPPNVTSGMRRRHCAARVNVNVSYQMSYVLEQEHRLEGVREPDMDVLDRNGILDRQRKSSSRKTREFPRSVDGWTLPGGMGSRKMSRVIQEKESPRRWGRSSADSGAPRSRRRLDPYASYLYAGRGVNFEVPAQRRIRRKLWSLADSRVEPAGSLFKDLLAIVGLMAFVVSGTYAFAISHRYLNSRFWFRKAPSESVALARSAKGTHSTATNLTETSGAELTDDTFVDTIQERPTFVLFYATWCPYCQRLDTTWKELEILLNKQGYDVQLARLNAEMHPTTAKKFKIVKYPTIIFFKDGIAVDNYLGPRNVDSFMKFIDENLHRQR